MVQRQIIIGDQLINYLVSDLGEPTAPAVVFLHGWGGEGKIWQEAIGKLPDVNYFALDLPGFGKSEMPKKPFTVGDYAGLVGEFVGKIGLHNVVLVGHSFGGRVAIKCAALQNGAIKKLVLVDSAGFRDDSVIKAVKVAVSKLAKPFVPAGLRFKLAKVFGASDWVESGELKQTFINIINEDLTEDMKRIKIPTLIIWGEDDKETPVEYGKKMNLLIPNSVLDIFQGAGHYSFLDKPAQFIDSLKGVLK